MQTIGEAIDKLAQTDPFWVENIGKPRLLAHDVLHVILWFGTDSRHEEIVAIYQSVLFRNDIVTKRTGHPIDGWIHVTLEHIHAKVLPAITQFTHADISLTAEEIFYHFRRAKILQLLFEARFGHHYGNLDFVTLTSQQLDFFSEILERADRVIAVLNWHINF